MIEGDVSIHDEHLSAMSPLTAYAVLALRADVFIVEQNCIYSDLDGRDLEPDARQLWAEHDGQVVATLRLLSDADGSARIGRVATARQARGQGLAAQLMARALELTAGRVVVLNAQAHLADWYERFGFARSGPDFLEDAIAHVPMRLSS